MLSSLAFACVLVSKMSSPELSAFAVNKAMSTGFNIGNTFDIGQHSMKLKDVAPLIDLYLSAGMRHVRIPVTWGNPVSGSLLMDPSGHIVQNSERLKDLDKVVDYALGKGLYVVVNAHHEHWLKEHYDGSPRYKEAFFNLWKDIALHFRNRSPRLLLEVLNEPEKAFGDWSGPVKPFDPKAIELTREINEVGWRAVRSVSATRIVMIGTNGQGNHSMLERDYPDSSSLPGKGQDKYLMATVHTYDPWPFCGDTGSNAAWPGVDAIVAPIRAVAAHGRKLGLPINYGEFGVGRRTATGERDTDLVRSYYVAVKKTADAEGLSITPWDDRGWFALTRSLPNGKFAFMNDIVPTMMKSSAR